jgi:hypothetical protein
MYKPMRDAIQEYNDAIRLFDYATSQQEIDVAITLMYSAEIKIKALKTITNDASELQYISEVY